MADLPSGVNTFSYSGSAVEYDIPGAGTITVELWGAGGGGAYSSNNPGHGGAGALVQFEMNVSGGDVLKIEVGQGGRKAPNAPGNGGLGGWPDGGAGGAYAPLAPIYGCPGGGGSTRIYINNTLVAVAGAGGGGIYSPTNNGQSGGHGGGTTGGIDDRNFVVAATQSQGGYPVTFGTHGVTPNKIRGGYLAGGNGWRDGSGDVQADNNTTPTEWTGAGGGGGYYGGSGGAAGERQFPAAGGGTSYANGSLVSSSTLTSAFWFTPPDTDNRPDGVAEGGLTGNGTQTDGGDGYVWLDYAADGQIGEAEGDLATTTLSAISATVEGGFNASYPLETVAMTTVSGTASGGILVEALLGPIEVQMTVPDGQAEVTAGGIGGIGTVSIASVVEGIADSQVYAIGEIGTVEVQCLIVAGPELEANITLDLLFELEPPQLSWTGENDFATGEADIPGEDKPDLVIGNVSISAVQGYYYSEDQEVEITDPIGEITFEPMEGYAAQAIAEPYLPGPITAYSLIEATATGAVSVSGIISFIPEGGGGGVLLGPLEGTPSTADMETGGDIGTIAMDAPWGVGLQGDQIVLAVGLPMVPVATEWTNTNLPQGTGEALARPVLDGNGELPADRYICRVVVGTIFGAASGGANKTVSFDLTVTFGTPTGVTQRGQTILAPIGTVFVRRALGGAGENPAIEGDALGGAWEPIIVTGPVLDYAVDGKAQGEIGVVLILPPVEANVGQDFPLSLPGPILVTPPEGNGWEVDPESTGNGDLTALVVLTPPEGSVVALVAADLPPAVRVYPILTQVHTIPVAGVAVFRPMVEGQAIFRRVENGVAVVETVIERTVVVRG